MFVLTAVPPVCLLWWVRFLGIEALSDFLGSLKTLCPPCPPASLLKGELLGAGGGSSSFAFFKEAVYSCCRRAAVLVLLLGNWCVTRSVHVSSDHAVLLTQQDCSPWLCLRTREENLMGQDGKWLFLLPEKKVVIVLNRKKIRATLNCDLPETIKKFCW